MSKALEHRNIPGLSPTSGTGTQKDPCIGNVEDEDGVLYQVKWWWEDPKTRARFRSHGTKIAASDSPVTKLEPKPKPKPTARKRAKKGKR